MAEFIGTIELGYKTTSWGSYKFTFPICTTIDANDGLLPFGSSIASVVVRAFLGNITRKSVLDDETEIEGLVCISPTVRNENEVLLDLNYVVAYKSQKVTLVFEVTLTSGSTRSFYFQYVHMR